LQNVDSPETLKNMLRASSNIARRLLKQGARNFSAAAESEAVGGANLPWALGGTVAAVTAGAVVAVRSQHAVLIQEEKEWLRKVGGASAGHDSHHGKH
jgi:hypothetical protein